MRRRSCVRSSSRYSARSTRSGRSCLARESQLREIEARMQREQQSQGNVSEAAGEA